MAGPVGVRGNLSTGKMQEGCGYETAFSKNETMKLLSKGKRDNETAFMGQRGYENVVSHF